MSLYGVYSSQNIFTKIICGEAPYYKVYGDEDVLASLGLFPQSYGHTLVIPEHVRVRNLFGIDAQNLAKVMVVIQRPTRVLVEEVQPGSVQTVQFNDVPVGQTVFHIHFHVIPRLSDRNLGIHAAKQDDPEVLA